MLAQWLSQYTDLDEVWMLLSPCNPLKADRNQADDASRLAMLRIAVGSSANIVASDFELSMPRPNYTIRTLHALSAAYPDHSFRWIIGSDNWAGIDRWFQPDEIIRQYGLIVYPRPGYPIDPATLPDGVTYADAPICSISSTMIREAIAGHKQMNFFLPPGVYEYITAHNLYTTND
ncbi:MAG: nicotinate (nicotinamide) nucleotide adenylyltransferase, partial [Muribaculaceae bacterium]|nr:nicotinate (nicotinamide) nucleotide adenylyltransferase [Muribaculaceae bacterium]